MKKLLLTAALVTATLAVDARRSTEEIIEDVHSIIDRSREGLFGGCVPVYTLSLLEERCKNITHFGPGFPNAVEEEQELKSKCEEVLQHQINCFEERMPALPQENKFKNEILLEELKDLQKEMLQPFDQVIEHLKETKSPQNG